MRPSKPDEEGRVMRAFVCIDGRDWEVVVRGVARYLREGEALLAHVIDERGSARVRPGAPGPSGPSETPV